MLKDSHNGDSGRDLIADLRTLAAGSGLPRDQLQLLLRRLVQALTELAELRTAAPGKARRRLALGRRVYQAQQAGMSIPDICERFGIGRTKAYQLSRTVRETADGSV